MRSASLSRLPFERVRQPAELRLHFHLLNAQLLHFVRLFADRWEVILFLQESRCGLEMVAVATSAVDTIVFVLLERC